MKEVVKWMTDEIVSEEAKYRFENKDEYSIDKDKTLEEITNELDESDFLDGVFETLLEDLTELMQKVSARNSYKNRWFAEVSNFGWRSLDGSKTFRAENGSEFLHKILPDTDCSYKIFRERNVIKIQNYYHDSPMGKEWYTIRPMTKKEVEDEDGR